RKQEDVVQTRRPATVAGDGDPPNAAPARIGALAQIVRVVVIGAGEFEDALHPARRRDFAVEIDEQNGDAVRHLHDRFAPRQDLRKVAADADVFLRLRRARKTKRRKRRQDRPRHFTSSGSLGSVSSSPSRSSPLAFTLAGRLGASMISNSSPDLSAFSIT